MNVVLGFSGNKYTPHNNTNIPRIKEPRATATGSNPKAKHPWKKLAEKGVEVNTTYTATEANNDVSNPIIAIAQAISCRVRTENLARQEMLILWRNAAWSTGSVYTLSTCT